MRISPATRRHSARRTAGGASSFSGAACSAQPTATNNRTHAIRFIFAPFRLLSRTPLPAPSPKPRGGEEFLLPSPLRGRAGGEVLQRRVMSFSPDALARRDETSQQLQRQKQ